MSLTLAGTGGIPPSANQFLISQVVFIAGITAPAGFLKCNGAAVSRATYSSLFALIGTTYGVDDGSTTFNLPELRGEFLRCADDGRGIDTARVLGSAQADAFQGHYHSTGYNAGSAGSAGMAQSGAASNGGALTASTPITDGTNGTPRISTETRPRNVALLACIFTGV